MLEEMEQLAKWLNQNNSRRIISGGSCSIVSSFSVGYWILLIVRYATLPFTDGAIGNTKALCKLDLRHPDAAPALCDQMASLFKIHSDHLAETLSDFSQADDRRFVGPWMGRAQSLLQTKSKAGAKRFGSLFILLHDKSIIPCYIRRRGDPS